VIKGAIYRCIDVSRTIEINLDRESYALGSICRSWIAIKIERQYVKMLGRTLIVQLEDEKIELN
jgi:hypothetical protein